MYRIGKLEKFPLFPSLCAFKNARFSCPKAEYENVCLVSQEKVRVYFFGAKTMDVRTLWCVFL